MLPRVRNPEAPEKRKSGFLLYGRGPGHVLHSSYFSYLPPFAAWRASANFGFAVQNRPSAVRGLSYTDSGSKPIFTKYSLTAADFAPMPFGCRAPMTSMRPSAAMPLRPASWIFVMKAIATERTSKPFFLILLRSWMRWRRRIWIRGARGESKGADCAADCLPSARISSAASAALSASTETPLITNLRAMARNYAPKSMRAQEDRSAVLLNRTVLTG